MVMKLSSKMSYSEELISNYSRSAMRMKLKTNAFLSYWTSFIMKVSPRDQSAKTGEWIIFTTYNNINYYLCLATHNEAKELGDNWIFETKIKPCFEEFPELRKRDWQFNQPSTFNLQLVTLNHLPKDSRGVLATEAEGIAQGNVHGTFLCFVEREVHFRVQLRVVREMVDGRWYYVVLNG